MLSWKSYLLVVAVFLPFVFSPAFGLESSDKDGYAPLVTIAFPLDNQPDTAMGHQSIQYILYPDGTSWNKRSVYGGTEKQQGPDHFAGLSQSHKDAVLKLVSQLATSEIMPASRTKAVVLSGSITNGKIINRDFSQNIIAIRQMLRLLGGVRGDLENHLADATSVADSVGQRRKGWSKVFADRDWVFFEGQASQTGSDVSALLGSRPKAFNSLFNDVGRFDGEKSERVTLLLIYLDCKLGHKAFLDQLSRQQLKWRQRVSSELLSLLAFKQDIPSGFEDFAGSLRQEAQSSTQQWERHGPTYLISDVPENRNRGDVSRIALYWLANDSINGRDEILIWEIRPIRPTAFAGLKFHVLEIPAGFKETAKWNKPLFPAGEYRLEIDGSLNATKLFEQFPSAIEVRNWKS